LAADFALWNAIVSTATLVVVAVAAVAAFRQLRHLRSQTAMAALLKILEDWRDPDMRRVLAYVRMELPKKIREPGFLDSLDAAPVDRGAHPELELCDWYEQLGSYLKYGVVDEAMLLDVGGSSANALWALLEPVIVRMRRTRSDALYENFEYLAVRGALFDRAHPDGCYPRDTPRMADLGPSAYGKPVVIPVGAGIATPDGTAADDAAEPGVSATSSTAG
jgi:hypothetical protein